MFLHLNALISRVGRVLQIFSRISLVYSPHRFRKCYSDSLFMIRTAGGGILKKKHLFIKVIIFGTSGTQRSTPFCGVHQECMLDHQKKSFRWCCFYPNFMFSKKKIHLFVSLALEGAKKNCTSIFACLFALDLQKGWKRSWGMVANI